MEALAQILLIIIIGLLIFYEANGIIWVTILSSSIIIISFLGLMTFTSKLLVWLSFIVIALMFNIPKLRQTLFTLPLLNYIKQQLPPLSETEKIALDAGDTWWEGELLSGRPHWKKLFHYAKPCLTTEEQLFINNHVETLCTMINPWEISRQPDLPTAIWNYIKAQRFLGLVIPKEYGGLGFSALAHSTIISKIASRNYNAAISIMVPNSLGPGMLLQHYGTIEQKKFYLPRLASGQEIPCFALTGIEVGSDAGAMPDKGIVCYGEHQGEKTLGIRLSWEKRYITLAPIATLLGLAFKLYDPEHLLGNITDIGITLCLIPTSHPGVEIGKRHLPAGLTFMNGPTEGKNVFIPIDWIIGGVDMAGQGWRMLTECLGIGRGISLPALSAGFSTLCYRTTGAYARIRQQFRQPIGNFEGVANALAKIGGFTYLIEATRHFTTIPIDNALKPAIASAIAKYHLTELSRQVVNDAMDIHGGRGIQLGPKNYLFTLYQALPINITVEGANILTRNLIIFGQGVIRCHPYLRTEMQLAADKNGSQRLIAFDAVLRKHFRFTLGNIMRTFISTLPINWLSKRIYKKLPGNNYYLHLNRMSAALALISDIALLTLGGKLKRKEQLSARLGDVVSYLYLASATLKYFHDQETSNEDRDMLDWTLDYCLHQMQNALNAFLLNYPKRWLSYLLRFIIFPFGQPFHGPSDKHHLAIAERLLKSNELREKLTSVCFTGCDNESINHLEKAFKLATEVELWDKKLKHAVQTGMVSSELSFEEQINAAIAKEILVKNQADKLRQYEIMRREIIQVDAFNFNEV